MSAITVPINGRRTLLEVEQISLSCLILDEENPRIGLFKDNHPDESLTPDQIKWAIAGKSPEAYKKLKEAIQYNRGIINPVWLEPMPGGQFKVVEGNTRVLIYNELSKLEPLSIEWKNIIAYKLPEKISEDERNFIRLQAHLRGTNDWDAYEKAKYLYKLSNDDYWPISKIESQTKLRKKEIELNIAGYKIMQEFYLPKHPDDPSEVSKFSYFVEFAKDKKLQKVMKSRGLSVEQFCDWVGDRAKIPRGQDVRRLQDILSEDKSASEFISKGFDSAVDMLEYLKPNLISPLYKDIERMIDHLKELTTYDIEMIAKEDNGEKEHLINELAKWSIIVVNNIDNRKHDE